MEGGISGGRKYSRKAVTSLLFPFLSFPHAKCLLVGVKNKGEDLVKIWREAYLAKTKTNDRPVSLTRAGTESQKITIF